MPHLHQRQGTQVQRDDTAPSTPHRLDLQVDVQGLKVLPPCESNITTRHAGDGLGADAGTGRGEGEGGGQLAVTARTALFRCVALAAGVGVHGRCLADWLCGCAAVRLCRWVCTTVRVAVLCEGG